MEEEQLSLFDGAVPEFRPSPPSPVEATIDATPLSDAELIASLYGSGTNDCPVLALEVGKRRLREAIPALKALCVRFAGFGDKRVVPQQATALEALVILGDSEAARAIAEIIIRGAVRGPGLVLALNAAARLSSPLPAGIVATLLRHDDPEIRAKAACCAGMQAASMLVELLDDLLPDVSLSAACSLGRMGRVEAKNLLLQTLQNEPSPAIVDAVARIGDEECVVLLGRTASDHPVLAQTVLDALDLIERPLAARVAARIRRPAEPPQPRDGS